SEVDTAIATYGSMTRFRSNILWNGPNALRYRTIAWAMSILAVSIAEFVLNPGELTCGLKAKNGNSASTFHDAVLMLINPSIGAAASEELLGVEAPAGELATFHGPGRAGV